MKVVFDTNTLLSSTLWENSSAQKTLIKLIAKNIQNYTSIDILNEYKEILEREFKYTYYEIREFINKVISFSNILYPSQKLEIVKTDPNDNTILECAIEAKANFIITYDKYLLNLKKFQNIEIKTPEEIFSII